MAPTISLLGSLNNSVAIPSSSKQIPVAAQAYVLGANVSALNEVVNNSFNPVHNAALANGASLTIWTPSNGSLGLWILGILVSVSIAGQYNIQLAASDRIVFNLVALTPFLLTFGTHGWLEATPNQALSIVNNSGSASNVFANAWGTQTVP